MFYSWVGEPRRFGHIPDMETELSKKTLSRIRFYKYLSLLILHYNRYPVLAVKS